MSEARRLAVIGTAGRDQARPMDRLLWEAMLRDLRERVLPTDTLISGGAAWADHLAVHAYLNEWVQRLELYLPAPFTLGRFEGYARSSGAVANYYHLQFSRKIDEDTLGQIESAIARNAAVFEQPTALGYDALIARNTKVAERATHLVAYTFGEGDVPLAGGTSDTWNKAKGAVREHVPLASLLAPRQALSRAERFAQVPRG